MAKTNFYLDKPDSENCRGIFLYFSFNGKRIKLFTNELILEKDWNPETMRARKSRDGSVELNLILDKMQSDVERIYREMLLEGIPPTAQRFKERLNVEVKHKSVKDFWSSFETYMHESRNSRGANTLKKYQSTLNHLKKFSARKRLSIDFDDIDDSFLIKFSDYLIHSENLTNNTIAKYIKTLKSFMNWAVKKGLTKNLAHKVYQVKEHEGEIYFLTLDELMTLYKMPIANPALERVRDVFCFGCFTGLRYSDIQNMSPGNIRDGFISFTTIKTQEKNNIPLNEFAKTILKKYSDQSDKCLPAISNQKMNEHLKILGKESGFDRMISQVRFQGAKRIENSMPLYEVMTTHIARKTFITNSIFLGMNSEAIMEISGQKTRKAYKRYFTIVDQYKQTEMEKAWGRLSENVQ